MLKKGHIYSIDYPDFRRDPRPLILVLYSGDHLTHAININYLGRNLSDELISFIAHIATKKINYNDDTYALYHNYIKNRLPGIIKVAYRTYKTYRIKEIRLISKGFFEIKNFLNYIKQEFSPKEIKKIKSKIKKSIRFAQDEKKQDKAIKVFSLFKDDEEITSEELDKRVNEYMGKIDSILTKKIDFSKYTRKR